MVVVLIASAPVWIIIALIAIIVWQVTKAKKRKAGKEQK
jgi:flagellar basal body-associated protein FliL